jgi:hypothetical protein
MTKVINLNTHPVSVRVNTPSGVDYVYVMPRGRVDLQEGFSVDHNWLVGEPRVRVVELPVEDTSDTDTDSI